MNRHVQLAVESRHGARAAPGADGAARDVIGVGGPRERRGRAAMWWLSDDDGVHGDG